MKKTERSMLRLDQDVTPQLIKTVQTLTVEAQSHGCMARSRRGPGVAGGTGSVIRVSGVQWFSLLQDHTCDSHNLCTQRLQQWDCLWTMNLQKGQQKSTSFTSPFLGISLW